MVRLRFSFVPLLEYIYEDMLVSCSMLENCHIIQLASLMANVSFILKHRWLLFNCFSTVSRKCKWPARQCLTIINAKACL